MAKKKHIQSDSSFDTIVIGSGPAGSTAAELLALAGQKVAIVEAEQIGGECLNYGCIPTKSMLSSAHLFSTIKSQKTISNQGLLKLKLSRLISKAESDILRTGAPSLGAGLSEAGVKILNGRAYFLDSSRVDVAGKSYAAKNFIIASGGDVRIPKTPGLDGIDPLTYKNFLQRVKLKVPRSVTIIGGGVVGCEYAQILINCGIKVNIIECRDRLLDNLEPEASNVILNRFKELGINIYLSAKILGANNSSTGNFKEVQFTQASLDGGLSNPTDLKTEEVMVATGKSMRDGDGFQNAGINCQDGFIQTDAFHRTSQPHIYAIGDATGPLRLTSTAILQAKNAAHNIANKNKNPIQHSDYNFVPASVFTSPEVAYVGVSTQKLLEDKLEFNQSLVQLNTVLRSSLEDDLHGFVKIWTNPKTGLILGACLVGHSATEQISILSLAIKLRIPVYEIADLTQVFPTWSEAISSAAAEL